MVRYFFKFIMKKNQNTIAFLHEIFTVKGGNQYDGEAITQFEHAAQAALIADKQGLDEEMIVAAFLHDIGHLFPITKKEDLMDTFGIRNHESLAGNWLKKNGFSSKIISLIENHVNAKRYLVAIDEHYYQNLSEASRKTLEFQGGKMTKIEAQNFKNHSYFKEIIQLRKIDEAAKLQNQKLPNLDYFLNLCAIHLTKIQ
jgi:2-amino-1-hydroxyethylphosphonate dioxygenase (glycine-forming)